MNAQKAQRYPVAAAAFQKALQISPQTGNVHLYLSRLYLLMGDKAASLEEEKLFRQWERKKAEEKTRRLMASPMHR
jgi:cytochrome c-type biogenesis protein CcmH/NrfG